MKNLELASRKPCPKTLVIKRSGRQGRPQSRNQLRRHALFLEDALADEPAARQDDQVQRVLLQQPQLGQVQHMQLQLVGMYLYQCLCRAIFQIVSSQGRPTRPPPPRPPPVQAAPGRPGNAREVPSRVCWVRFIG